MSRTIRPVDPRTNAIIVTMEGETWAPFTKSTKTYVPLVCDMAGTVHAAVEAAVTLVEKLRLYPGSNTELFATFAAIADWADAHQASDLLDLSGDVAARMLCDLTGITDLDELVVAKPPTVRGKGRPPEFADLQALAGQHRAKAYHYLYALIALRAAAVWTRTRSRKVRLVTDSLAVGLPTLPKLVDRKSRPMIDEEILLARFMLEIDLAEKAPPRQSLAYLLAECGIRPIESTALETDNLDDRSAPRTVTAPGAWEWGERTIKLTRYATSTAPGLLAQLRAGVQPLTFTGEGPGTGPSTSSLSGTLKRHLRRAGVADSDVSPKSLSFWRVMRALTKDDDIVKARRFHGGRTINILEDLKLKVDDKYAVSDRVVYLSRSDTGAQVATVPVADYNDGSATLRGRRRNAAERKGDPA